MRIKKLSINGFKGSNQEAFIELKNPVSILYGLNGSGKTTILKLIHAVLSQNDEYLIREDINGISIEFSDDSPFEKMVNIWYDYEEEGYNWKELEDSPLMKSRSLLIGVQRGLQIRNTNLNPSLIYEYLVHHRSSQDIIVANSRATRSKVRFLAEEMSDFLNRNSKRNKRRGDNLLPVGDHVTMDEVSIEVIKNALIQEFVNVKRKISTKIYNALFQTFALAIDEEKITEIKIPSNIVEIIKKNKKKIIEALEGAPDNEFKQIIIQRIKKLAVINQEYFESNKLFTKLLLQMVKELENEQQELSTLNILISVFNSMLGDDKQIVMSTDGIIISTNGNDHELNELSSGERHLLTFLTIILLDGVNRDFILIDEPEISLNILWQEKLINLIGKLAPFSQIIIASHSQSIVSGHTNALVGIEKRIINE